MCDGGQMMLVLLRNTVLIKSTFTPTGDNVLTHDNVLCLNYKPSTILLNILMEMYLTPVLLMLIQHVQKFDYKTIFQESGTPCQNRNRISIIMISSIL